MIVSLNAAALAASAQALGVYAPVPLSAATLTASAQAVSVVPGAIVVLLVTALITSSGQGLTVQSRSAVTPSSRTYTPGADSRTETAGSSSRAWTRPADGRTETA